jgi:hypothetical protein
MPNVTNAAGTAANYIPKFTAAAVVANSIIFQSAAGNVGIGTITPASKLDVAGIIQLTGFRMPPVPPATINNFVLTSDGSGNGTWKAAFTGTPNFLPKFTGLNAIGNSVISESVAGNIGIGTATPGAKLDVTGTIQALLSILALNGLIGRSTNPATPAGVFDGAAGGKIISGQIAGVEKFSVDDSGNVVANGIVFPDGTALYSWPTGGGGSSEISESGGMVGIGIDSTRNPQEKLTLAPDSNMVTEMPTPSGVVAAASPASGGLAASDYYFRVTASEGAGWTKASAQLRFDLLDNTYGIRVSWNPVLGATKYRVYRALTATGAYKYIETTETHYDYVNDSLFTLTGSPPEETTAYVNKLSAAGPSWFLGENVGIGTTAPDKTFTVKSATNGNAQIAKFADDDRYIGIGRDEVAAFDLSGNLASLLLGGGGKLRINPDGNIGIGTATPRDTLDIGGGSSPAGSFGLGSGKMKSQNTSVPANAPTVVYSSGNGSLIGTLYVSVTGEGGTGNSTMFQYRLITNSNGADGTTAKLDLVDSLSRGNPPGVNMWLSNLGPHGAINVNMTSNAAAGVNVVFVGLENH